MVERAEEVLATLESGEQSSAVTRLADDLPLFAAAERRAEPRRGFAAPSALETALSSTDLDTLTPKQALDLLYAWKALP